MKKIVLILFYISINLSGFCQVQTDTIWYDMDWVISSKDKAEYYRPPLAKENYWYAVKDYYKNGQVQMEGHTIMADSIVFEGLFQWFDENGGLEKKSNYSNGNLEGETTTFVNGQKYKAIYKNGKLYSGILFYKNSNGYYKTEFKDGSLANEKIFFDDNYKKIKVDQYSDSEKNTSRYNDIYLIEYYDLKGSKIGQMQYSENGESNGVYVHYYEGENAGQIYSIQHLSEGKVTYVDLFYSNGNPKSFGTQNNGLTMKYYSENGMVLDSVVYKDNKPYQGCQILFSNNKKNINSSQLRVKSWYDDGNLKKRIKYHKNGSVESITHYEDLFSVKKGETKFDENGVKLGYLEYENGNPVNGVKISKNEKIWFENGKKIKIVEYYLDGTTVFKEQILTKVTFYSMNNKVIGMLEKDSIYGTTNINGKDISKSGNDIYKMSEYLDGKEIKETSYYTENDLPYVKEVFYENVNNYSNKVKELTYHANGKLKSKITFSKGYYEKIAIYYNTDGIEMGTYDFEKKHGTKYTFFGKSEEVESIKTYEDGELIKEQLYKKLYNKDNTDFYTIILIRDLDLDTKATFYDNNGEFLSELTFQNRKPFTGRVYDDYGNESVDFFEGQKHGQHLVYSVPGIFNKIISEVNYINDKKEGLKKSYYYNGELEKTEMYKNDELNGDVICFLKDGSQTKVVYKNNKPFEGEIVEMSYGKKSVLKRYANGDLEYKMKYLSDGNIEYQYNKGIITVKMFYPESDSVKYEFHQDIEHNRMTGSVIRFNKKGKEMHRAVLKENKLISGQIWLKSDNYGAIPVDHCLKVAKTEAETELKLYDNANELQFSIKERNDTEFPIISKKLNYSLDYITEERLY